jgi:hypothetical protein
MMIATQTSVSGFEVTSLIIGLGVLFALLALIFNNVRGKKKEGEKVRIKLKFG